MDINEAIFGRHSTREFTADTVEEKTIRRLIDAAAHAPNASNEQPWSFIVVRDQEVLQRISTQAKSFTVTHVPEGPLYDRYRTTLSNPDFHIFYHAPVLIVISGTGQVPFVVEDCALAAENLMLSAHAAGLGTCWIGFSQHFLNTPEGKNALGIPSTWVPVAPIIVGHPKDVPSVAPPGLPRGRKEPEIRWIG